MVLENPSPRDFPSDDERMCFAKLNFLFNFSNVCLLSIAPVPVCVLLRAIPWPGWSAGGSWCRQLAAGRAAQPRQLAAVTAGPELPSRRWPGEERGDGDRGE